MSIAVDERTEWLETDGLGGFASGTARNIRTRRYHALLLAARTPPTGRFVLVNGLDVVVRTPEGAFPLSFHRYTPGVTNESDRARIESFSCDPWPRWILRLADGTGIVHEVFVSKGAPRMVATWRLERAQCGAALRVRPLLSGRDSHALHHENAAFRFEAECAESRVRWWPYPDVPATTVHHNGRYSHAPVWYRGFQYDEERRRGFDYVEDLASPGTFDFDLSDGEAALILTADTADGHLPPIGSPIDGPLASLRAAERHRRAAFGSALERAADDYVASRGNSKTVIAGYPWFADWGRDTFIALRGLCLATGRIDDAHRILVSWANTDSDGVLPNRFPDGGGAPEYNSVDASLWFIIAAREFLTEAAAVRHHVSDADTKILRKAIQRILAAYAAGTHHGIRLDSDGLLAAGEPGVQLTWMDARVGGRVITPRVGKPVEVQALWLNALRIGAEWAPGWHDVFSLGLKSFRRRFWNDADGCLRDVIDVNHVRGDDDPSLRPNQILAVGGLPLCLLPRDRARRLVSLVEARLLTPLGLRSLAPGHPDYAPRYFGNPDQRDAAYHQGTVWPWLLGPFVEAWLRVRGDSEQAKAEARARFLAPMLRHLTESGIGHVSEVMDAEPPHTPGGCPFQAWSVGEVLRLDRRVLAQAASAASPIARVRSSVMNRSPVAV